MSKGMVYTSFALMASALMISGAFVLSQQDTRSTSSTRITEASFFLDSVLQDMDRSLSMATRRAFTASTNYVIINNQPLSSPEKNISSALVNGTISGEELDNMEDVSIEDWSDRVSGMATDSSYSLSIKVTDYGINASGMKAESYYSVFASLKDPVSLATFNRTETAYTSTRLEGVEDPMITLQSKARYVSKYTDCGFDEPAEDLLDAGIHSETYGYGEAVVNPSDISTLSNPSEKVIVVDDVDSYQVSEVNNFAAAVSLNSNSSSGYSNAYAFDVASIEDIETNQTVLVDGKDIWVTRFHEMFSKGCYVPDDEGPDVLDRIENKLSNDGGEGLATMIDVSKLPSELRYQDSAVAYVYFDDDSHGGVEQIKGVSDRYSWFRLDQQHIDGWSMNSLVK